MAFTQTDIDALKKAIGTGALRVQFADREVTYRSLKEMREVLAMMRDEVDAVAGTKAKPVRQVRFLTSKGLR